VHNLIKGANDASFLRIIVTVRHMGELVMCSSYLGLVQGFGEYVSMSFDWLRLERGSRENYCRPFAGPSTT